MSIEPIRNGNNLEEDLILMKKLNKIFSKAIMSWGLEFELELKN